MLRIKPIARLKSSHEKPAIRYVKLWTETTDRGGLKHVSEDTYRCFKALELITYELLQKGATKTEVISQAVTDDNVLFYWDFVMHEFASEVSTALLLM